MKLTKEQLIKMYKIEKDKYLDCYIVWEIHTNYIIDIFRSKLKKDCKNFIKELSK